MERYLFLYLKTGGGHLAPAKAVADQILRKHKKDVEISLADGLTGSNHLIKTIIEDGYKAAINRATWTFEFLYLLNKIKFVAKITSVIVGYFVKPALQNYLQEFRPDKIVIFHFFLIDPVYNLLKEQNLNTPVITVVTDPFTAHPLWFLRKEQNYIVFSEILKEKCIEEGINEDHLKIFPFVLDNRYSRKISKKKQEEVRESLGFMRDSRIILILGGGDGMPRGKKILKKLLRIEQPVEIAIVCGKNRKLYNDAAKLKKKHCADNLKIYGFINNVHSLISVSDVVVTKCGASTAMEILLLEKIPLINNYIWEQEKGNMEFVTGRNMGLLEKNTESIPIVIERLFNDKQLYETLTSNIRAASMKNGVGLVSDYILNFR